MKKKLIIGETIAAINKLPIDQAVKISQYANALAQIQSDGSLNADLTNLPERSEAFDFLKTEPDLYTTADLKEVFDAEG